MRISWQFKREKRRDEPQTAGRRDEKSVATVSDDSTRYATRRDVMRRVRKVTK